MIRIRRSRLSSWLSSTYRGTKRPASLQPPKIQLLQKIGGVSHLSSRTKRKRPPDTTTGWPWTPTCPEPRKAACERTLRLQNETTPPSDLGPSVEFDRLALATRLSEQTMVDGLVLLGENVGSSRPIVCFR